MVKYYFNKIIDTEFCKICYSVNTNAVMMNWLPDNSHMSEWEFVEQIDTLVSSIEVFNATTLYIDAFDFCYPINDSLFQQIVKQLETAKVNNIGIVISSDRLGQFQIIKIIKTISSLHIPLTTFKSREEGELWVSVIK